MSRIASVFRALHRRREGALIVYLPVGYPTRKETVELISALCEAGADLIELGVPFSDPLADGPTIQRASRVALAQGVTVRDCLDAVAGLRLGGLAVPVALMGYINPFLAYGIEHLARDSAAAGVDGLIVPDLPPEHSALWGRELAGVGLDRIQFLAPTTRTERLGVIATAGSGFLYSLSVAGVTGSRNCLPINISDMVTRARAVTDLPVAVGFGISTPEQVRVVCRSADGAIVGSALIEVLERAPARGRVAAAARFIAELKAATQPALVGRSGSDA